MVCVLRFSRTFLGKTHSFKICALKKRNDFRQLKKVISEWRSAKQRIIYQSSWITWPIRLWLLWGIVLWKESLCKTWIVFILIKCICLIIKINHMWSRVKNIALKNKNKHCLPQKPIVFQKKTIVFQHVHFFIPLFWNGKLSLLITVKYKNNWKPFKPNKRLQNLLNLIEDFGTSYDKGHVWKYGFRYGLIMTGPALPKILLIRDVSSAILTTHLKEYIFFHI